MRKFQTTLEFNYSPHRLFSAHDPPLSATTCIGSVCYVTPPYTARNAPRHIHYAPNVNMSLAVPSSPSPAGPRPLQLVDGNLQSPAVSSCPSPTPSGLSTPPPSAHKFHPRRQSSISYYPSDHSPSWDIRSPTTASRPSSLRRSTSLNQRAPARLDLKGDRRSLPLSEVVDSPQAERPPLTLTEK